MNPIAAIVLCAGKGTRMKSSTIKVLHPILGRPLAAYPVARALEVGCSPVVAVIGHQADAVRSAMDEVFPKRPLQFAIQREQNGTADAVRAARPLLESFPGTLLILYGDTPLIRKETLVALLAALDESASPLALVTSQMSDPTGYGRVVRRNGAIERVVEQEDATPQERALREVNAGIYAVEAPFLWRALEGVRSENAQRELYLTDLVSMASAQGGVAAVQVPWDEMAGVNDRAELAACAKVLQSRINLRHMQAGVSMEDPASTFVHEDVTLAVDVTLGPNVTLTSGTRLDAGVRVGQGSVLVRSTVAEGVEIKPYSVLEDAKVGPRCVIGPFSRLRPGTELAEEAHIGNFVETKKARIGRGSKANHLAYLGDAQIGAGVNVGAGVITCNYDGVNKHVTIIEDGVFVGSDSQFVAPVRVGRGAWVAAGTTVTCDVPPDALVLTRPPTTLKEGWGAAKRPKK